MQKKKEPYKETQVDELNKRKRQFVRDTLDGKPCPGEIERHRNNKNQKPQPKPQPKKPQIDYNKLRESVAGQIGPDKFLHGFIVQITGKTITNRRNIILIDETETTISDTKFRLLLAFISRLKKNDEGWISNLELYNRRIIGSRVTKKKLTVKNIDDEAVEKLCNKIREIFRKVSGNEEDMVIETKSRHHRLSIPPKLLIIENHDLLKKHKDPVIKKLNFKY